VSNDTQPNFLYVSQPDGKYAEVANDAGMAYDANGRARAGMGVDVADLRDDGCYVVSIGNFSGEPISMYSRRRTSSSSSTAPARRTSPRPPA
jgi:hypothetical protein